MDVVSLVLFRHNVKYKTWMGGLDTLPKWVVIIRSQCCSVGLTVHAKHKTQPIVTNVAWPVCLSVSHNVSVSHKQ